MKIGVLTHNSNAHNHRRLAESAHKGGHEIRFIRISHCYMSISETSPSIHYRGKESFEDLDAIIPHINPAQTFYGTAVLRQFEMMGIFTLNSSIAITWSRDKIRAFQLLARKHLALPITGFADSPEESEKLIEVVGGAPLIIRLLEGPQGRGTIFAETQQAALSVINAFKQLKTNILVQEFIKEANGNDIRCIIIGNKVIAAVERSSLDSRLHNARYPTLFSSPVKISVEEKKIALRAAKALKLNFATIDLIRSNRGPLVLDIDCSPNIEMLEKITGKDIGKHLIHFLSENAKKKDST